MQAKSLFVKIVVVLTALAAIATFIGMAWEHAIKGPEAVHIDISGQPTAGNLHARVQMIVFEDFKCETCREYSQDIFPQIEDQYIKTGKVRYTMIPLGFMEGSKPIGNAALAVYHIAPDCYFPYAHELFSNFSEYEELEDPKPILLALAEKVGGIDLEKLKEAIESNRYYADLDRNFEMGEKLMGAHFGTPALFINGIRVTAIHFSKIRHRIEQDLALMEEISR